MRARFAATLLRLGVSAVVLMLSVGWVSPGNPRNTLARALVVSLLLAAAWIVTLARFLWFLLLPWLLYACVWLLTVKVAYGLGLLHSILLALALTLLSAVVDLIFGLEPL
jgi:putative membrane protein